jgi:hypothetical protein
MYLLPAPMNFMPCKSHHKNHENCLSTIIISQFPYPISLLYAQHQCWALAIRFSRKFTGLTSTCKVSLASLQATINFQILEPNPEFGFSLQFIEQSQSSSSTTQMAKVKATQ